MCLDLERACGSRDAVGVLGPRGRRPLGARMTRAFLRLARPRALAAMEARFVDWTARAAAAEAAASAAAASSGRFASADDDDDDADPRCTTATSACAANGRRRSSSSLG